MGWFSSDRASKYKRELAVAMKAVIKGEDANPFFQLVHGVGDLPRTVFDDVLSRAVEMECESALVKLISMGAKCTNVPARHMVNIVLNENLPLFRRLAEAGVDFSSYTYHFTSEAPREYYVECLSGLRKDVEREKLKADIEQTKKDITQATAIALKAGIKATHKGPPGL